MDVRSDGRRDGSPAGSGSLMLRAVVVVTLALVLTLSILVRPLPEAPLPEPSHTAETLHQGQVASTAAPLGSTSTPQSSVGTSHIEPTLEATATRVPTKAVTPTRPSTPSTPTPIPTTAEVMSPTTTVVATAVATPTTAVVGRTATPGSSTGTLAGRVEQGTYLSQVTGRAEGYRIYLPPSYDGEDRRYPVLYLLHGWPYDESHWDDLGVDEAADARIGEGAVHPFIIVLPGADAEGLYVTTSGGAQSFEEQLVNELMPHVDERFRTLQTREARAIGGISRGGVWALEIGFRHADAFGIVGAHSPALSANRAPPVYDPFALLREPGVERLRIYLSAGEADWARQETVELHQALARQGIQSELAIHPGAHQDEQWQRQLGEYLAFYTSGW